MGLNYNYLLYFKKEHLWDALQGVGDFAETYDHSTTIVHFPDHQDLALPFNPVYGKKNEIQHDASEFNLETSLIFEKDEAILDYLAQIGVGDAYRAPPDPVNPKKVAIGIIDLTVYADLSQHFAFKRSLDLVLFKFGTTGTRMSMLFSESTSIRTTFIELLKRIPGLCGILDREMDGGELFWLNGRQLSGHLSEIYLTPDEVEEELKRGW